MSTLATTQDSASRQALRCLLWKPGRELVPLRTGTVFGVLLSDAEFEAAFDRLGIGNASSPLDPHFQQILPFLVRSVESAAGLRTTRWARYADLADLGNEKTLERLKKTDLPHFLLACATLLQWLCLSHHRQPDVAEEHACAFTLEQIILKLGTRKVPWPAEVFNAFVRALAPTESTRSYHPWSRPLAIIGDLLIRPGFPEMLDETARRCLPAVRPLLANYCPTKADRARLQAIDRAMPDDGPLFHEIHACAEAANAVVRQLPSDHRPAFVALCRHASACNASHPSKAWTAEATRLIGAIDGSVLRPTLTGILEATIAANPFVYDAAHHRNAVDGRDHYQLQNDNGARLLGLACVAGATGDERLVATLAACVESAAKTPAAQRFHVEPFAGACVRALALAPAPHLSTLNRLSLRIKWPKIRKLVAKTLTEAIEKSGLTLQDAEETTVPDFGLDAGRANVPIGNASADIAVVDTVKPSVTWRKADGSPAKSPVILKKSHPDEVESVQRLLKDIEGVLPAQRTRFELLLRDTRTWRIDAWRQRYLDHGLLAPFARRLIWNVDGTPALFIDGAPQDVHGHPVPFGQTAEIAIWHPVGRTVAEIVAWRDRLESLQITQPFKQAHREVYILTDAELNTRTYSNRFAAHIVKTGAFIAIGQTRRWKVSLYGMATLDLPQFDLRAEFWSNAAGDEYNDFGGPKYLSTDQIRFYRTGSNDPLPLFDVPAIAFSEVMRDADLFVGISSVGADPTWRDGGVNGRFRDYWATYSFGDLNTSAKTRREVLERLVPRLRFASQATLTDKFLVIRGSRRTYKIHLGSGNILMEPNDQYLCIVPNRSAATSDSSLFLPFEGDTMLAIILSKAFLLADDTKITDPTITRQIEVAR